MKASAILKQVLTMCETEQQGMIEGGLCESWRVLGARLVTLKEAAGI